MLPKLLPEIEKWRAPEAQAPRVYFSGPLMDGAKVVYDGDDRPEIGIANATSDIAVANVEALVAAGVDFIKIYELVSPEVFATLVAEAERHGLPIAAHVPLALLADTAGPQVGSMEHLRNVELACAGDAEELLLERASILADPGEISGYSLRSSLHSEFRPRALANLYVGRERCTQVIRSLRQTIPGYSLHTELERLVDAGLSPMQAIRSATIRPAEFLGLQDTHGQIQAGQAADMVLLRENPTLDIRNTRSIVSVISKGKVVR